MQEKEYRQAEGLSQSELNTFIKSPKAYEQLKLGGLREETTAMIFGSAFHTKILEPKIFNDRFVVADRRTTIGKEKAKYCESIGQKIITDTDYQTILAMEESLFYHPTFRTLYEQRTSVEEAMFWNETISGKNRKAKGRLDFATNDSICDLKTTDKPDLSFRYSIKDFGYHRQAAWYLDAKKDKKFFIFIAIQKKPPFDIGLYTLSDVVLDKARLEIKDAIEKLEICEELGIYPSLNGNKITEIGEI